MKKIILSILLGISFTTITYSQNIKTNTIQWSSIKTMDISHGDFNDEQTSVISYGTNKVEWKNQDGSIKKSFQVIEVIGDWANVSLNGSATYEVTDGTYSGTITFRKDNQGIRIMLVIISDPQQLTELTIQSIQAQ